MEKLRINIDNERYYTEDFIKGWKTGVEAQFKADVREQRPKGEWIKSYFIECCGTDENHNPVFRKTPCVKCDQCGEKRRNEEKFCPNCGAKMGGDTK